MKIIKHEFVEFIPDPEDMEEGVIYVSIEYDTAIHKCMCGCGQQVVTPLSPTDWKLIYNGESISLQPSIGNWDFKCRSHYWIKNGKVQMAGDWSEDKIQSGRHTDLRKKKEYYSINDSGSFLDKVKSIFKKLLGL
jgi:hypothetical protein